MSNNPKKFWEKVDKRGPDDCWLWTGAIIESGYGSFCAMNKKIQTAHCYSHFLATGEIGDRRHLVCHRCNVPACVNPEHLYMGTPSDNSKDRFNKQRIDRACEAPRFPGILTDRAIDILISLRDPRSDPRTWNAQDRASIERALELLEMVVKSPEVERAIETSDNEDCRKKGISPLFDNSEENEE